MSGTTNAPAAGAEVNLAEAVRRNARERADEVALVQRAGSARTAVTWAELDRMVDESAAAFDGLGLVAGHRVAVVMTNTIEAVAAWFGGLRGGLVVVPLNPGLTETELPRYVEHAGARVVLADAAYTLPEGVRRVPLHGHRDGAPDSRVVSPADPEAIAAIIYTSGSQGDPKGAMISHRALLAYCRSSAELGVPEEGSVALAMLPLFHVYGLNAVLGAAAYVGARCVLVEGLPDDICRVVVEEKVSHLPVTPSVLYRLLQDDELVAASGSLRMVNSGAAPMPAVLGEQFARATGRRVEQGYGLTEASPGVSSTFGHAQLGAGHVGRPMPGVEVRIGEGDDPQEPALLYVRGENLFSGYWPEGEGGPDDDGWFATGDLAYLQGEDLFLVDRARELIIVSGFNVYPSEVEEVLEAHESVDAAAVVGMPDEHTGERVVAFLEGRRVQPAAVRAHAYERLARYKAPSELVVVKKMPRTSTGKIRKGPLRDMLDRVEED